MSKDKHTPGTIFPLANEEQQKAGWKYDCVFMADVELAVTDLVMNDLNESVSMEAIQIILTYIDSMIGERLSADLSKATEEIAKLKAEIADQQSKYKNP